MLIDRSLTLNLIRKDDMPSECHLTFQVSPELYQRIDTEALFHLKPELRSPLSDHNFQSVANIKITVTLQPQLLSSLTEWATDSQAAIAYLKKLTSQN